MRYILAPLYRVWFYIAAFLAIVVLFPAILFSSLHPRYHRQFARVARLWGRLVLMLCGYRLRVEWDQRPEPGRQYIICTNHTSMLDIMLTQAVFDFPFLFIGKKELTRLPIFGYFYRKTNILVDRSSLSSRKQSFNLASAALAEGKSLCIYPEGLAPREEVLLAPFKMGAFKLAVSHQVSIIPATFFDCKALFPFDPFRGKPGLLRVRVHAFLHPQENSSAEALRLKDECYALLLQSLSQPETSAP